MSDPIHLSLWFPAQPESSILPRLLQALQIVSPSGDTPSVRALTIFPVSWHESPVIDERFSTPLTPAEAVPFAADFVHQDYAYEVELAWDLWQWDGTAWSRQPSRVLVTALGEDFAQDIARDQGHLLFDLGSDELFLASQVPWNDQTAHKLQLNIAQLLALTMRLQAELKPAARLLWSEDDSDLARKLVARLQQVQ